MDPFAPPPSLEPELQASLAFSRHEMRDEYLQPHDFPWIVGFSGGKDSTLVAHLVFEMLLSLPPDDRRRPVHIVSNDTLVESPLVMGHISSVQAEIAAAARAWNLPVKVVTTQPSPDATFWVNLIGRGYPSPNRTFRWCTDRMKILPTSRYIREQVASSGEVILLLGVRRDESSVSHQCGRKSGQANFGCWRQSCEARARPGVDKDGRGVGRPPHLSVALTQLRF